MKLLPGVRVVGMRRRRPASRVLLHRCVAVGLAVVLSVAIASPARAQFDFLNPFSWMAVQQMIQTVGQMVSIKRQIENGRNMVRSEVMGALAPLVDGLEPVRRSMDRVGRVVNDASRLRLRRSDFGLSEGDVPVLEQIPFNDVPDVCTGVIDPDDPTLCIPDLATTYSTDADGVAAMHETSMLSLYNEISTQLPMPANFDPAPVLAEQRAAREAEIAQRRRQAQHHEVYTAEMQAHVDSLMGMVEEYYGCLATPANPSSNPSRPYCVTNDGQGQGDAIGGGEFGTAGLADDLMTKLDAIAAQPDGNASQTQLQVIQTRASMYRARAAAMSAQVRAFELEQESQARLLAEARQRRNYEIFNANLRCQTQENSPYARFVPNPGVVLDLGADNAAVDVFSMGTCQVPNLRDDDLGDGDS